MTRSELRREIKKIVDQLPPERLASLADYVHFLGRPPPAATHQGCREGRRCWPRRELAQDSFRCLKSSCRLRHRSFLP